MKVFFDTNVLIAAFGVTRGLCADLFAHVPALGVVPGSRRQRGRSRQYPGVGRWLRHLAADGISVRPGAASLLRITRDGVVTPIVGGLRTAIDVLPLAGTLHLFYVLEYSNSFLTGGPGKLLRVDATRGTRLVLADGLVTLTSLAFDTRTGDLFVTENTRGGVLRVLVPR